MTNAEIAACFGLLADLMKLHGEEDFRFKAYEFASRNIKSISDALSGLPVNKLKSYKGIGDAIAQKIMELSLKGQMSMLNSYLERTPPGIVELLMVKGIGPGKLRTLWTELGIENPGELLYACYENRLTLLKGFGVKSQETIKKQVEFQLRSSGQYKYSQLELLASDLCDDIRDLFPDTEIALTGAMRRRVPVVQGIEILIARDSISEIFEKGLLPEGETRTGSYITSMGDTKIPVILYTCPENLFGIYLLKSTGAPEFIKDLPLKDLENYAGQSEQEIFSSLNIPYIYPEYREGIHKVYFRAQSGELPTLIEEEDIKGVAHVHTNYSDGVATLKDMTTQVRDWGYEWIAISDHSQSAFYAQGLKPDRLEEQWAEIEKLNQQLAPFHIFKSIESDILNDGSLDYSPEILKQFDLIIASVHSNLRMDETKATNRILKAIENPYTRILGHPTGRLLLAREGYPLNMKKIIDACADNQVAIEINANPNRLDLDWTYVPYALEKGVKIAINPDAHSIEGVHHIRYGIMVARKGGLDAANCLNCMNKEAFENWLHRK